MFAPKKERDETKTQYILNKQTDKTHRFMRKPKGARLSAVETSDVSHSDLSAREDSNKTIIEDLSRLFEASVF